MYQQSCRAPRVSRAGAEPDGIALAGPGLPRTNPADHPGARTGVSTSLEASSHTVSSSVSRRARAKPFCSGNPGVSRWVPGRAGRRVTRGRAAFPKKAAEGRISRARFASDSRPERDHGPRPTRRSTRHRPRFPHRRATAADVRPHPAALGGHDTARRSCCMSAWCRPHMAGHAGRLVIRPDRRAPRAGRRAWDAAAHWSRGGSASRPACGA